MLNKLHPSTQSILDVACGTAEHDRFLSESFDVDGIDLNEDFVSIAREKNPSGKYVCADMIDFDLNRKYDVILCLFGSIGYVKTVESLIAALDCFKRHLQVNGFILVEPWFTPEDWKPGTVTLLTAESDEGKICRMSVNEKHGLMSVINFHYLIGTSAGIQHHKERHELGLFSRQEMIEVFNNAGLAVEYDPKGISGRGLYSARHGVST